MAGSIIAQIGPLEVQRRNAQQQLDKLYGQLEMLSGSRELSINIENMYKVEMATLNKDLEKAWAKAKDKTPEQADAVQPIAAAAPAPKKAKAKGKRKAKAKAPTEGAPRKRGRPPGSGKKNRAINEAPAADTTYMPAVARPSKPNGAGTVALAN